MLRSLDAKGGGDDPESALEALALAMKSDWTRINDIKTQRTRHVIILCTDAAAHSFEESKFYNLDNYPKDVPNSYKDFLYMWNGSQALDADFSFDKRAKRLLIFAPEGCYPWDYIGEDFEQCAFSPVEKGLGLSDISAEIILDIIFDVTIPY